MVAAVMNLSITPGAIVFLDMGDVFAIVAGSSIAAGIGVVVFVKIGFLAYNRISS